MAFVVAWTMVKHLHASKFCICNGRMFTLVIIVVANVHGDGIIGGDRRDFE
jgi:hypothetical protein